MTAELNDDLCVVSFVEVEVPCDLQLCVSDTLLPLANSGEYIYSLYCKSPVVPTSQLASVVSVGELKFSNSCCCPLFGSLMSLVSRSSVIVTHSSLNFSLVLFAKSGT